MQNRRHGIVTSNDTETISIKDVCVWKRNDAASNALDRNYINNIIRGSSVIQHAIIHIVIHTLLDAKQIIHRYIKELSHLL